MVETHGAFEGDPRNKYIFDEIVNFSNSVETNSVVVDVGAGQCELEMFFQDSNYIGIDLAVGDEKWDFSKISVLGDVQQLPFKSSFANVALNIWVMEHIPNPQSMVDEMFRILKPGGKVFLVVPFALHEHQQPHDFYRYTRFGVRHLFDTAGFTNVNVYSDSSEEFAMGHEAYKWLSALSGKLSMNDEQRKNLDFALNVTKSLMFAAAEQFPAKTGGFALNWICRADKKT